VTVIGLRNQRVCGSGIAGVGAPHVLLQIRCISSKLAAYVESEEMHPRTLLSGRIML